MTKKIGYGLLKEKVPEFRNPWIRTAIFIVWFLYFLLCMVFFWWFDSLFYCGALVSQLIVALLCSVFAYAHMKNARIYREKYGNQAYRFFFFRFIMPIFATYYACIFHPLLVNGRALLPFWLAVAIGVFLISFKPLTALHIKKSGFDNIGHGLGIYTVYPEEGTGVFSEIYFYIRHPMYLGSFGAALGFAFFRNNTLALFTALIFLIPLISEMRFEDKEMIGRFGEEHKKYIKITGAMFPKPKKLGKFLKLMFFWGKS